MLPNRTSLRNTKITPSRMDRHAPPLSAAAGTGASETPAAITAADPVNSAASAA